MQSFGIGKRLRISLFGLLKQQIRELALAQAQLRTRAQHTHGRHRSGQGLRRLRRLQGFLGGLPEARVAAGQQLTVALRICTAQPHPNTVATRRPPTLTRPRARLRRSRQIEDYGEGEREHG